MPADATGQPAPIALIADGSKGPGLAVARALAGKGYRLRLAGPGEAALAAAALAMREDFKIALAIHPADLTEPVYAEALVMEADDADVLITAFGPPPAGGLFDVDDDDWRGPMRGCLHASVFLSRAMLEIMGERDDARGGAIVVIASPAQPAPGADVFRHMANRALAAFCQALAQEAADSGVGVHFIEPAPDDNQEAIALAVLSALGMEA